MSEKDPEKVLSAIIKTETGFTGEEVSRRVVRTQKIVLYNKSISMYYHRTRRSCI